MSSAKPTVLLIEDADDIRLFIKVILQSQFTIKEAASGEEALQFLKTKKPDTIVSDLMMPGLSGSELVDALTKITSGQIPIIVLSADKLSVESMAQVYPNITFMTKPFKPSDLRSNIQRLLAEKIQLA